MLIRNKFEYKFYNQMPDMWYQSVSVLFVSKCCDICISMFRYFEVFVNRKVENWICVICEVYKAL